MPLHLDGPSPKKRQGCLDLHHWAERHLVRAECICWAPRNFRGCGDGFSRAFFQPACRDSL